MFQFYSGPSRTFEVQHPIKQEETLHLNPPLLETARRLDDAGTVQDLVVVTAALLSRNTEGETITAAEVGTSLDYDQLRAFIRAFRAWLIQTKASDPN